MCSVVCVDDRVWLLLSLGGCKYESLAEMSDRREARVEWAVPGCRTAINIRFAEITFVWKITIARRAPIFLLQRAL